MYTKQCTVICVESYGGCISYKELTKRSGLLENLQPGDTIMADCGSCQQLEPDEVVRTRRIANFRIHAEQAIE